MEKRPFVFTTKLLKAWLNIIALKALSSICLAWDTFRDNSLEVTVKKCLRKLAKSIK